MEDIKELFKQIDDRLFDDILPKCPYENPEEFAEFNVNGADSVSVRNREILEFMQNLSIDDISKSTCKCLQSIDFLKIYKHYIEEGFYWGYYDENGRFIVRPIDTRCNIKIDGIYSYTVHDLITHLVHRYKLPEDIFFCTTPKQPGIISAEYIYTIDSFSFGMIVPVKLEELIEQNFKNLWTINKECADKGYYCVFSQFIHDEENCFIKCIYAPVKLLSIREMMGRMILFHCAFNEKYNDILNNGLTLVNGKILLYARAESLIIEHSQYDKLLAEAFKQQDSDTKMNMYAIDSKKLPKDIEVYFDTEHRDCIYTTVPISKKYVERHYIVDFSKEPIKYEVVDDYGPIKD